MVEDIKKQRPQSPDVVRVRRESLQKLLDNVSTTSAERALAAYKSNTSFSQLLRRNAKKIALASLFVGLTLAMFGLVGLWYNYNHFQSAPDPVPLSIRKSVSYDIYYPDSSKLPQGYTLNVNSFANAQQGIIIYTVSYGNNQKLIFSLQQKPSDSDLQTFYRNQVPLHFTWPVNVGTAIVGVIRRQTFVSLPTSKANVWILVTGPVDVNQTQLKQVLQAIRKAN